MIKNVRPTYLLSPPVTSMPYCVKPISLSHEGGEIFGDSGNIHKTYVGAWKEHIKINYDLLTTCKIDFGDYLLHFKVLVKSIFGRETNWNDVGLSGENCGTKIVYIN